MISFKNLLDGITYDLENHEVDKIEFTEEGIEIIDIYNQEYLTKIIEMQ